MNDKMDVAAEKMAQAPVAPAPAKVEPDEPEMSPVADRYYET